MARSDTESSNPVITYRGENGDSWAPVSQREVWDYAVRTGQVIVPSLDDGGQAGIYATGDQIEVVWVPPEYAGRLKQAPPPPQPTVFVMEGDDV